MGARFDSSLGVFRLLQWNARELELTIRLCLRSVMQTVRPNVREAGRALGGLFGISVPARTDAAPQSQHRPAANEARTAQPRSWRVGAVTIVAASVGLGYVVGRASSLHDAPSSSASAEVTVEGSSAPEGLGPSAWALHVGAVQGASQAPAEDRSTAKLAIAPMVTISR